MREHWLIAIVHDGHTILSPMPFTTRSGATLAYGFNRAGNPRVGYLVHVKPRLPDLSGTIKETVDKVYGQSLVIRHDLQRYGRAKRPLRGQAKPLRHERSR